MRAARRAPAVPDDHRPTQKISWYRLARSAAKEQQQVGVGTAEQKALKEDLMKRLVETGAEQKATRVADAEHRGH